MDRDNKFHFRILEDIARDLSDDANFPTCLDAAVVVRNTLNDPNVSLDKVSQAIGVEPLIASKLLRLANSVAYNPSGREISDLKTAIGRLGFESVRTTSLAVAMDQMRQSQRQPVFTLLSKETWEYSLEVAAISRVLARRLGRINPDEAMVAGMVQLIGIFYLLYRAGDYPEYRDNQEAVLELLVGWQESIGENLLHALGLTEHIIEAVRSRKNPPSSESPCTLSDALYFANLLAGDKPAWLEAVIPGDTEASAQARDQYAGLLEEAEDDIQELRTALAS